MSAAVRSGVRRQSGFLGLCLREAVAVAASLGFSFWFALRQLDAVSPEFRAHAPVLSWLPTLITSCLAMLCIYVALRLTAGRAIKAFRSDWPATARVVVFSASVIGAIAISPLAGAITLVAAGALLTVGEFATTARADEYRRLAKEYLVPFAVVLAADWLLITSVSPSYLGRAATRSGVTYLVDASLAMSGFVNAFSFSFSTFYHGYSGAAQEVPTGLTSIVLSAISFLNIFPLWEASSFFKIVYLMLFGFFVAASWFFYLFLRQVRVSLPIATAAASVYVAGNGFFMRAAVSDNAWYVTEYVALPVALFAAAKAFRSGSLVAAAWAGLVVASQFYLMAPHPEAAIYSVAVFAVLALSCLAVPERSGCSRGRAFAVCVVSGVAFTLGAVAYLAPIAASELTGTMDVVGRKIALQPGYTLPIPLFYFVVVGLGAAAELYREYRFRHANWAVLGFLFISAVGMALAIHGVAADVMIFTERRFAWAVHLLPPDRFLTWLGLGTIVIAAFGADALLVFLHRSRWWADFVSDGGHWRVIGVNAAASLAGFSFLVLLMTSNTGNAREGMIFDARTAPFYEAITAALANSLAPADQRASLPYVRARLTAFEIDAPRSDPAWAHYAAELQSEGVGSAQDLREDRVRPFARRVASIIDASSLRMPAHDDLPQNKDGYLAGLDDPYARVMAILGSDHQADFLGAGRNVRNMHNSSEMYDTGVTIGFPMIHALYMYPLSALGEFQTMKQVLPNYSISWRRYPWLYYDEDVFGDPDFRKILNIGGVSDYVTLPSDRLRQEVARDGSGLVMLPNSSPQLPPRYFVIADTRAYDAAYLARVVSAKAPANVAGAEAAAHGYYRFRIDEAAYHRAIEPLLGNLLSLERRHDAIIEGATPVPPESDNPSARGGRVEIDGIAGPRTGIKVICPDPSCWLVYNLAALPGWRAYVDGRPAPIARANYAFLAVEVAQGPHYVGFFYLPLVGTYADLVSLAALLALLVRSNFSPSRAARA